MTEDTTQSISNVLRSYISDVLLERRVEGINVDTPLLESGILDSFSVMMLVNFIDERFGVQLVGEEVNPNDLASVQVIAETIERRREA